MTYSLKRRKIKVAKLSKKKEVNTTPAVDETQLEETVAEEKEPAMTEEEKEAIQKAEEDKAKESADTKRLQLATNIVSDKFNLDPSYSVKKFDDKGKVVNLTLENSEFILNVTIKDSERHGMYID